jgi:hypothetical protein
MLNTVVTKIYFFSVIFKVKGEVVPVLNWAPCSEDI